MHLGIEDLAKMRLEFWADDHEIWTKDVPPEQQIERQNQWKDLNEKLQTEMETIGKESDGSSEGLLDQVQVANRERYDYKKFLRKFSILKEEMKVDTDSFDYIFYNYGMSLYGNMPLIEPQETKEAWKVEDFVIAIDALAARNTKRLNRTIQIADTGISPGSGVGNHRAGITKETLGIPVIAIGVPTVVDAATIVRDTMEHVMHEVEGKVDELVLEQWISPHLYGMFVTPKDIDETIARIGITISEALNMLFTSECDS